MKSSQGKMLKSNPAAAACFARLRMVLAVPPKASGAKEFGKIMATARGLVVANCRAARLGR